MENLNAEQVKKALKRCASGGRCKGCVRENITTYTIEGCMGMLLGEALALIESQEERIKELALRLGVSEMSVWNWENGRNPSFASKREIDEFAKTIK